MLMSAKFIWRDLWNSSARKLPVNCHLQVLASFMSESIPTGYIAPRATPGDSLKKNYPGGSGFVFSKLSGGREFDNSRDFVESSNYANRHINMCSRGDLCSPFLTIFFRHPV